jgi:hypothetical protein
VSDKKNAAEKPIYFKTDETKEKKESKKQQLT